MDALIVRNARLVLAERVLTADLAVADGRVVAIGPELHGSATEEIDATGLHVFPGVIDAHVHLNEPGRTGWEGWTTGSAALAAGGATTCFDMPLNSHPPTLDAASFAAKRAVAEAASVVDFALWGGLVPGNLDRLDELADAGAIGFKAFLSNSGIPEFPAADDETLFQGMIRAASLGRIVAVHAENDAITAGLAARAMAAGRTGVRDYLASRPAVAEVEAIARALLLAEDTGCALHIVHVSTGRGVALVAQARMRGLDVSCETCPHYLAFTEDDLERLGAVAKCAPPLRPGVEMEALWERLGHGEIDLVASDHSPAPPTMKTGVDFFAIWGGISGCQSLLPLLLTEGHHVRGLPLPTVARLVAGSVARRFALPTKGRMEIGADADFALVALDDSFVLAADDLKYRHRQSPFIGRRFRGRVVRTILRGVTTYANGTVVAAPMGRLWRPER